MKKYFDFTLTGKKFLPIWLLIYVFTILPYVFYFKSLVGYAQTDTSNSMLVFLSWGMILASFIISFFLFKISIESVKYADKQLKFDGKFGTYFGKIILGFILSMLTLTIYIAWYISDITRYIIKSTSLNDSKLEFQGKGGKLFVILLLSLYIPMTIVTVIMSKYLISTDRPFIYSLIYQVVIMIIMIPYIYLYYKWMVDIKYKDYQIRWQTEFKASCAKILLEMLLIIVTCGIYLPLAYLKLYKYFADKTIAVSPDETMRFGYELDTKGDFLFFWGQILLTIITAGIYYPWAYSKIGKRVLRKTFIEPV